MEAIVVLMMRGEYWGMMRLHIYLSRQSEDSTMDFFFDNTLTKI